MNTADQNTSQSLEALRRMKQEVRQSQKHLIVGVDIAKEKHYAFFGDASGRVFLKRFIFSNTLEGFEAILEKAEKIRSHKKMEQVVFGVEPTADYHKPLAEWLFDKGYLVTLVSATAAKRNRELLDGRWDKNDTKDAANIADLLTQGKCLFYDHSSETIKELRSLLSYKRKLKSREMSLRVRIRNHLLAQYFPELDPFYTKVESECLAIMKHCFSPKQIAEMELQEFIKLIVGRRKNSKQIQRVQEIWTLSKVSIGCNGLDAAEYEARHLAEQLEKVRDDLKVLSKKVQTLCETLPEYKSLMSIPGFGPIVSSLVLAAIGTPHRFTNYRQVLKLAGLDLSASRSGSRSEYANAKISKKGKAELRYALYQAALIASSRSKVFRPYWNKIGKGRENERGIGSKMRIKLSAKLLVIAWTLMKKRELFDEKYLNTAAQK